MCATVRAFHKLDRDVAFGWFEGSAEETSVRAIENVATKSGLDTVCETLVADVGAAAVVAFRAGATAVATAGCAGVELRDGRAPWRLSCLRGHRVFFRG